MCITLPFFLSAVECRNNLHFSSMIQTFTFIKHKQSHLIRNFVQYLVKPSHSSRNHHIPEDDDLKAKIETLPAINFVQE